MRVQVFVGGGGGVSISSVPLKLQSVSTTTSVAGALSSYDDAVLGPSGVQVGDQKGERERERMHATL